MSKLKNGTILVGTHGNKKHKASWIHCDGVLHAMNPLAKTISMGKGEKLPLNKMGQHIHKITNDINEVREHSVPFYTNI